MVQLGSRHYAALGGSGVRPVLRQQLSRAMDSRCRDFNLIVHARWPKSASQDRRKLLQQYVIPAPE
jgi:hypothetical protein